MFRGVLDVRAHSISDGMAMAAALMREQIIPDPPAKEPGDN
jgi:malic enzyme